MHVRFRHHPHLSPGVVWVEVVVVLKSAPIGAVTLHLRDLPILREISARTRTTDARSFRSRNRPQVARVKWHDAWSTFARMSTSTSSGSDAMMLAGSIARTAPGGRGPGEMI